MTRAARTVVISLALAVVSCADPSATDPSPRLDERVANIRLAIENGDAERARTLIERLENVVGRLVANGGLTEEQGGTILVAAQDVADALVLIQSEASPSFSPSPSPDEDEGNDDEDDDEEHGKGKGKGRGHGNDDEEEDD